MPAAETRYVHRGYYCQPYISICVHSCHRRMCCVCFYHTGDLAQIIPGADTRLHSLRSVTIVHFFSRHGHPARAVLADRAFAQRHAESAVSPQLPPVGQGRRRWIERWRWHELQRQLAEQLAGGEWGGCISGNINIIALNANDRPITEAGRADAQTPRWGYCCGGANCTAS